MRGLDAQVPPEESDELLPIFGSVQWEGFSFSFDSFLVGGFASHGFGSFCLGWMGAFVVVSFFAVSFVVVSGDDESPAGSSGFVVRRGFLSCGGSGSGSVFSMSMCCKGSWMTVLIMSLQSRRVVSSTLGRSFSSSPT